MLLARLCSALVSIDAIATIANSIRDADADDLRAVKANQPGLRAAAEQAHTIVPFPPRCG